jgi:hypothetical protein
MSELRKRAINIVLVQLKMLFSEILSFISPQGMNLSILFCTEKQKQPSAAD